MESEFKKREDYYETLVQNIQKGEMYLIKFINDPEIYTGIPFIRDLSDTGQNAHFVFKILSPDEHKGIIDKAVAGIEILERKSY